MNRGGEYRMIMIGARGSWGFARNGRGRPGVTGRREKLTGRRAWKMKGHNLPDSGEGKFVFCSHSHGLPEKNVDLLQVGRNN
uniref:Uncharacterized protein n=1 Tax=Pistacia atlantica TaxID=434234 RepID=A0ACC1BCI7_9ROSI|nr:hypothetical protein Patl1_27307 [Pistacia atlantica]